MNFVLRDLPHSGKMLALNNHSQVIIFLPAEQYLSHSSRQSQGGAFSTDSPYPKPLPCTGSLGSCLQISRMSHSTLAEFTGVFGRSTEMKVLGTGNEVM